MAEVKTFGLSSGKDFRQYMFSRFHTIRVPDRRTDGRTDRGNIAVSSIGHAFTNKCGRAVKNLRLCRLEVIKEPEPSGRQAK